MIELMMARTDRGYVLMPRARWNEIRVRADLVARITACTTWGEYRDLNNNEFDDEVYGSFGGDDDPQDDDPFDVNLYDGNAGEGGGFDVDAEREVATTEFLQSLDSETLPSGAVTTIGPWSFIEHERADDLVLALRGLGFAVDVVLD